MYQSSFFAILEEMSKRIYLGEFELMVMLVLIRLDEEAYGVPISTELQRITGREVALGSVYAALERLEQKGMISSTLGDPTAARGGRAKRYFHVTPRGKIAVNRTRTALVNLWQGIPLLKGERA
jgi:PadR family transcriptional regulator PadR